MTTKQVLFRLDDSKLIALDKKLSDKGISKQFFLNKCVELFLEDNLSFDSSEITNDSSELADVKKQLAIIHERLNKLENDNKMIAFDKSIADTELDNNDSSVIASDSLILSSPIQSKELAEETQKEDITKESTPLELPKKPIESISPQKIPPAELTANNDDISTIDSEMTEDKTDNAVTEGENIPNCDSQIGTLTEAIDNVILSELAKDTKKTQIIKMLDGKYFSSLKGKSTQWQTSLIDRAIKYRNESKV